MTTDPSKKYEKFVKELNIQEVQSRILDYWDQIHAFEKSVQLHTKEAVFYDGPPFPTGQPHHGTVLVSFIKDMIARFLTMRGFSVHRVWGWDCHGLPIETQVEKKLGIAEKGEIERNLGIDVFNEACCKQVSQSNDTWRDYIREMARWVDYEHSYKTMDVSYMESVLWVFKTCFEKGFIYQDYRVVPYCFRCETSLSVSDARESDSTRPRQDPSIVVRFKAKSCFKGKPVFFLVWTTTPWTLPSNLALAVGNEIEYAFIDQGESVYIAGKEALKRDPELFKETCDILEIRKGADLVGWEYEPVFPYFEEKRANKPFRVIPGDFVDITEGTGVVHVAPAFGEDDYWACRKEGIALVCPVDEKGRFTGIVKEFAGRNVLEANPDIIRTLKHKGLLVDHRMIDHNYPHCWRCREPLIYKAMDAWYFSVEKLKKDLSVQNEQINWVPETVKHGRFGNWLTSARDWNISRNRYWSTPIPVWICGRCRDKKVLGSIAEIEEASGRQVKDLHRQYLDKVEFPCPCGGTFRRVPEVLDCWFESGAMPYAQKHYPFENKEWFETYFPADFIVEYTGQIRCWFYYLHVLAVALFGRPAFRNCIVHGTILDNEGKKLSKSSKNYTSPMVLMKNFGTDAYRIYLFQTPAILMGDLQFDGNGLKFAYQQVIAPLWNACSFFATYAQIDHVQPREDLLPVPSNSLDKWILSRVYVTQRQITASMAGYRIDEYLPGLIKLIDDLTNWYIRRSRRRFWREGFDEDKKSAFDTLFYALVTVCKLLSPVAPIIAEEIFMGLTEKESVHLTAWPQIPDSFRDDDLMEKIGWVRRTINLARSLRRKFNIKNRQPLSKVQVVLPKGVPAKTILDETVVMCEELNVKEIEVLENIEAIAHVKYLPNFKTLGPKLGPAMGPVVEAIRNGKIHFTEKSIEVSLAEGLVVIDPGDILETYEARSDIPVAGDCGLVVGLDIRITEDFRQEGIAREVVRHIQEMRKGRKYAVIDRIRIEAEGTLPEKWLGYICDETLGEFGRVENPDLEKWIEIPGGDNVKIKIVKT